MARRRQLAVLLAIPGRAAVEIDGLRRALGAAALSRIVPHVTLVPPRNVGEDDLPVVLEVVRRAASALPPVRLELGPPESFLPVTPVLYLSVGGDLETLAELRRLLLAGPLCPPPGREERGFVPHVTIDQRIEPARLPGALETLKHYRASVTVTEVTVVEFHPETRRWLSLAAVALGQERVVGRGGVELELTVSAGLDPDSEAFFEEEWAAYARSAYGTHRPERPYAVTARLDGEVVGTASGELRSRLCHLHYLIVAAGARRHGIGSQLVRAVERLAIDDGLESVRLETRAGGPAEGFYRRLGYEATAILPAWVEGRDFLLMEKAISPPRG